MNRLKAWFKDWWWWARSIVAPMPEMPSDCFAEYRYHLYGCHICKPDVEVWCGEGFELRLRATGILTDKMQSHAASVMDGKLLSDHESAMLYAQVMDEPWSAY